MSSSSFALAIGTVFHGRYSVVRCIKAGGMGAVYEVTDAKTASRRALKVMLPSLAEEEDFRSRFELEAKITGEVDSDHLVRVFDAGIDEPTTTPFLVMELLRGEEIGSIIKRAPLALGDCVVFLHQAALALDKTHAAGIIHRDLKPENLFLTRRDDGTPCVKILDFGIAKVVEQNQARATRAIGTPLYMSPEQIQGEGAIDGRADVYALGHIAYTTLVGEAYWKEEARAYDSTFPLLARVMKGASEPPTERALRRKKVTLPFAFDAWFARATASRSEDRFASASVSILALGEALGIPITRARASLAADSSGAIATPMSNDPSGGSASARSAPSSVPASFTPAHTTSPSSPSGANQSGAGNTSNTGGVSTLSEPPTRVLEPRSPKSILIAGAVLLVVLVLGGGFAVLRTTTAPASPAAASSRVASASAPPEAAIPSAIATAAIATASASASATDVAPIAPAATASVRAKAKPAPQATPRAPVQAPQKHEGIF